MLVQHLCTITEAQIPASDAMTSQKHESIPFTLSKVLFADDGHTLLSILARQGPSGTPVKMGRNRAWISSHDC